MPDYSKLSLELQDFTNPINPVVNATEHQIHVIHGLMGGDASFSALIQAVDELSKAAPADHDILTHAFNITVVKVRYIQPHTFIFEGFNDEGHTAFAACHFSQLVANIVYVPKRGPDKIITGFSKEAAS